MPRCFWLIFSFTLLLPGCYHMRVEVESIPKRVIAIKAQPHEAVRKIRSHIEDDWKCRILEADSAGTVLITAPYHFNTETGFGQPAGGRKYYTQLRIEVIEHNGTSTVNLSHYNFEIRTSYAFNQEGQLGTLYKRYPYEQYPGMFELALINSEMDRVSGDIQRLFMEYK